MDYRYDNENIRSILGRKKWRSPNWRSNLYFPSNKTSSFSSIASLKRNTSFLSRRWFADSNPSKMCSYRVESVPLIKRVWHSSFVPVNAETIFHRLKRKIGSTPPMWSKWFLLVKGFDDYLIAKRRMQSKYFKDNEVTLSVEVQTRGSTYETSVLWIKCEAHVKPASRLHTMKIF